MVETDRQEPEPASPQAWAIRPDGIAAIEPPAGRYPGWAMRPRTQARPARLDRRPLRGQRKSGGIGDARSLLLPAASARGKPTMQRRQMPLSDAVARRTQAAVPMSRIDE
ncbi:hypothetical protein OY671_011067, partial [Metschnikowia pulcherrima]